MYVGTYLQIILIKQQMRGFGFFMKSALLSTVE